MPIPTWSTGQVLASADVNSWFVPRAAYRTTTQSVTSNITPVNDNQLSIQVDASAVYLIDQILNYDGATGGDMQGAWTVPAGATMLSIMSTGLTTAATLYTDDNTSGGGGSTFGGGALGTGTNAGFRAMWLLTTAGTGGTLQMQWAQNTSSATATRMLAGSCIIATRIA
jgi:hypothetical protein